MSYYPDTTPRRPRSPRSEHVVRLKTNSLTRILFDGKEGNKNYKYLRTELLTTVAPQQLYEPVVLDAARTHARGHSLQQPRTVPIRRRPERAPAARMRLPRC
jgi:hypothetical protein